MTTYIAFNPVAVFLLDSPLSFHSNLMLLFSTLYSIFPSSLVYVYGGQTVVRKDSDLKLNLALTVPFQRSRSRSWTRSLDASRAYGMHNIIQNESFTVQPAGHSRNALSWHLHRGRARAGWSDVHLFSPRMTFCQTIWPAQPLGSRG